MFMTPLYQQHASHTLASRVHGPQPHMRSQRQDHTYTRSSFRALKRCFSLRLQVHSEIHMRAPIIGYRHRLLPCVFPLPSRLKTPPFALWSCRFAGPKALDSSPLTTDIISTNKLYYIDTRNTTGSLHDRAPWAKSEGNDAAAYLDPGAIHDASVIDTAAMWEPHIMDCPRKKWPRSPRIVLQCAPMSSKWP